MLESLAWKVVGIVHLIFSRNYHSAVGRDVNNEEFWLTVWLHEGPSIFNLGLLVFFNAWVPASVPRVIAGAGICK